MILPTTVEACDKRLAVLSSERTQALGKDRVMFLNDEIDRILVQRLKLAREAAVARARVA